MTSEPPSSAADSRPCSDAGLPIAVVEQETGLGKDTLRVWERRYQFPIPTRDASGDRRYTEAQVQQLKLIRRLLDLGVRTGKVVGLDGAALQAMLAQLTPNPQDFLSKTNLKEQGNASLIDALLDVIGTHDAVALRHRLSHALIRMGLVAFVHDVVAPLSKAVGEAWAQGRFEVFEEHLCTEVVTGVMRHAIVELGVHALPQPPKVLLTTLPQEQHSLGLLMVEALLSLEGCTCVSLGTQTPLRDIVLAAQAHQAEVVVLSFSGLNKAALVQANLAELRAQLPASMALWVGGNCPALYQKPLPGIQAEGALSGLPALVAGWRQNRPQ